MRNTNIQFHAPLSSIWLFFWLTGFFFSHIGWLMVRKHKDVIVKGKTVDLSDLEADPLVMFQKKWVHMEVVTVVMGVQKRHARWWCKMRFDSIEKVVNGMISLYVVKEEWALRTSVVSTMIVAYFTFLLLLFCGNFRVEILFAGAPKTFLILHYFLAYDDDDFY